MSNQTVKGLLQELTLCRLAVADIIEECQDRHIADVLREVHDTLSKTIETFGNVENETCRMYDEYIRTKNKMDIIKNVLRQ